MTDYTFRKQVLQSGLCSTQKSISKAFYNHRYKTENGVDKFIFCLSNEMAMQLENDLMKKDSKSYIEARKINQADYRRKERLTNRIETMLNNGPCLFLTLTFEDSYLSNMSEFERRVYITRYLKKYNTMYVANIDYGAKNHREHYHAIIQCEKVNHKEYTLGAINFERIHNNNTEALSKYISKLTNHAIKETTKRNAIIYSR